MLNVKKSTKAKEGSCNMCIRTSYKIIYVIEVALRQNGFSFRLCPPCKDKFINELKRIR